MWWVGEQSLCVPGTISNSNKNHCFSFTIHWCLLLKFDEIYSYACNAWQGQCLRQKIFVTAEPVSMAASALGLYYETEAVKRFSFGQGCVQCNSGLGLGALLFVPISWTPLNITLILWTPWWKILVIWQVILLVRDSCPSTSGRILMIQMLHMQLVLGE